MFRDGQYLEVIKVSNNCLVTAVVTVQKRTVEIKKRKVITNKWLQVEDWAALYKILEQAVLRNGQGDRSHREGHGCECRKITRQLEITYSFESLESMSDTTSLPTIKVHVSPVRKKSVKQTSSDETSRKIKAETKVNDDALKKTREKSPNRTVDNKTDQLKDTSDNTMRISPKKPEISPRTTAEQDDPKRKNPKQQRYTFLHDDLEKTPLEEYIPDAPKAKQLCPGLKYVPSRKSALENMQLTSNEYMPAPCTDKHIADTSTNYVPNSIEKRDTIYETYEPRATTMIPNCVLTGYIPNSKGIVPSIEEYEPNFKSPNELMKFDDSYIPSSVRQNSSKDLERILNKSDKLKVQRLETRRKVTPVKKKTEDRFS